MSFPARREPCGIRSSSQFLQGPVCAVEADDAGAGIVEIEDGVDRQRHRRRKDGAVEEMPHLRPGHAIAGQQRAQERDRAEQREDQRRQTDAQHDFPLDRHTDHVVDRRKDDLGSVLPALPVHRDHSGAPDPVLQLLGRTERIGRIVTGIDGPIGVQPCIHILAKQGAYWRLVSDFQHIGPQVGRTDRVGFLDDQLAPQVQAVDAASESKTEQKAEQCEDRAVEDSGLVPVSGLPEAHADTKADFEQEEHPGEEGKAEEDGIGNRHDVRVP